MTYKTIPVVEIADTYYTLHLTYLGGTIEKGRNGQQEISHLSSETGYFRWLDQENKTSGSTTRDIDYASRMTEEEAIALKARRSGWAKRNCVDMEIVKMVPYTPYEKSADRQTPETVSVVRLKAPSTAKSPTPIVINSKQTAPASPTSVKPRNSDQMRREFLIKLGLDESVLGTKVCNQQVKKWASERGLNPNLNTRSGWEMVTDWVEAK